MQGRVLNDDEIKRIAKNDALTVWERDLIATLRDRDKAIAELEAELRDVDGMAAFWRDRALKAEQQNVLMLEALEWIRDYKINIGYEVDDATVFEEARKFILALKQKARQALSKVKGASES